MDRYSFLKIDFPTLLNLDKFVLIFARILSFGLPNYNSFCHQCPVATAALGYEIYLKIMYYDISTVTPNFFLCIMFQYTNIVKNLKKF